MYRGSAARSPAHGPGRAAPSPRRRPAPARPRSAKRRSAAKPPLGRTASSCTGTPPERPSPRPPPGTGTGRHAGPEVGSARPLPRPARARRHRACPAPPRPREGSAVCPEGLCRDLAINPPAASARAGPASRWGEGEGRGGERQSGQIGGIVEGGGGGGRAVVRRLADGHARPALGESTCRLQHHVDGGVHGARALRLQIDAPVVAGCRQMRR